MSIFTTIRNFFRPKPKDSFTLPIKNYPPLASVTKPLLDTGEMAFYLGLDARTASQWEMSQGQIRPTLEKVDDRLWVRWRTEDVRRIAAGR